MTPKQLSLIHLVIILCLAVFVVSTRTIAARNDGFLHIYFLDIGQGDSIFIESPTGVQVLVDGGPNSVVLQELADKMPFFDDNLDAIVATHRHIDHMGGLVSILDRYRVDKIIQSSGSYESPASQEWDGAVAKENAEVIIESAGTVVNLGGGVELTFLHPFDGSKVGKVSEAHEDMVVAMLTYGDFKLLLTGDMEEATEKKLEEVFPDFLKADVLKVGHHGSKTSTTEDFLRYVQPQVAVIQVGDKNKYGHPTSTVLNRLKDFGITYYRNDMDGTIELVSDGKQFQITKK